MYPSDDRAIRIRLLIAEGRELRQRLAERIAESRELCAHAAVLCARAGAPPVTLPKRYGGFSGGRARDR